MPSNLVILANFVTTLVIFCSGKTTTYDSTMSRICSLPLAKSKSKNARKPTTNAMESESNGNERKKKPNPNIVDITNESYVRVYGVYLENQKTAKNSTKEINE